MLRYNSLENVWIVSPATTAERELGGLRRWLRTVPPFFLHVYPSSLYTFIDVVGEDLFRSLPVRGVIAASEMFPAAEQLRFEQEFGIKIAHWYGHSEYRGPGLLLPGVPRFPLLPNIWLRGASPV